MWQASRRVSTAIAGKRLITLFLMASIFSELLPQVNCWSFSGRQEEDKCPKLEVWMVGACRPCSLCSPDSGLMVLESCKQKHPDTFVHYGSKKLWCDNRHGPFPECPPIPDAYLKTCSSECNTYKRRFAPQCQCQVSCPGDQARTVVCTRDLQWSDTTTSMPWQCDPPSTTTTTTTTTTIPEGECPAISKAVLRSCTSVCKEGNTWRFSPGCECQVGCHDDQVSTVVCTRDLQWSNNSSIPVQCLPATVSTVLAKSQDTDLSLHGKQAPALWLWLLLGVFFGVIIVVSIGLGTFYFCWRRKRRTSAMSVSSQSSAVESDRGCKTEDPLLGPERVEKDVTTVGPSKDSRCAAQAMSGQAAGQDTEAFVESAVAVEISIPVTSDSAVPEAQALLARETVSGEGDAKKKTPSQHALQALLNSRPALVEMSRMFDQEDKFDKVTWHTVAKEFAEWDTDEIHRLSFMLRPTPNPCPGDGFIYQVLSYLNKETVKGLIELMDYLANRQHIKHPEAEKFLQTFFEKWKKENVLKNGAPC